MKKRTLSFLLALVMCLTLLPMTALAAGPSATAKGVTVTIDKSNYQQGEARMSPWAARHTFTAWALSFSSRVALPHWICGQ